MNIFEQLIRDESLELKPYRDKSKQIGFEGKPGKLTIGIGRNLDDKGLSEEESIYLCHNDVTSVTAQLRSRLPFANNLDEARFGVLLNMGFNMGVPRLMDFRQMLGCVQKGDYTKAAAEMANSLWYKQVGERARRLMQQMIDGQWQ